MPKITDRITSATATAAKTLKGMAKIALSRRNGHGIKCKQRSEPLIILGNGPSLKQTIAESADAIRRYPTMAVNFAANAPEFRALRPDYYILADPHFADTTDPNVEKLYKNLAAADWPMTLIVPYGLKLPFFKNKGIDTVRFPALGVEGAEWLRHGAIRRQLAMPRPRNVMVCAIMCGIWLGFKEIYITGADHSWTRTLSVSDDNQVVTIQPHFYEEPGSEKERIASVYRDIRLHQILESFSIAFKAYHDIQDYASKNSISIYNATPGSFIDAFPRRQIK